MLTESEILDRYSQALGEADRAAQRLGRHADPTFVAPRGHDYSELRTALERLEGCCRQIHYWRSDARWLQLSTLYARAKRAAQIKFVGQKWGWFNEIRQLFQLGQRRMTELREARTGRLSSEPILPQNPSSWLIMPDWAPARRPPIPKGLIN